MFSKKKKDTPEKKHKFLTKKFNATTRLGWLPGFSALYFTPLCLIDGGLITIPAAILVQGGITGLVWGTTYKTDKDAQVITTEKNMAEQNVHGPKWAVWLQWELQWKIIRSLKALENKDLKDKQHKKLQKQHNKLMKMASDLNEHITVVDKNNKPLNEEIVYLTKEPEVVKITKIDPATRIDSKGRKQGPANPAGFNL